ncbi:MAG: hypothetical protein AAB542_02895 [Patescibacteria group bacterium]
MHKTFIRVKGLGYMLWQARHMAYHVMLGLLWAWFLRERWGVFNLTWIVTAAVGSLLPDVDHIYYFFGYGRRDSYTQQMFGLIRRNEWSRLFHFIATNHKNNTNLSYHNIYVVILLALFAGAASLVDWQTGVVLFGAMVLHYLFDIADDIVQLGGINSNWKRWGRPKQ